MMTVTVEFNNGICTTKGFLIGKMIEAGKIYPKKTKLNLNNRR